MTIKLTNGLFPARQKSLSLQWITCRCFFFYKQAMLILLISYQLCTTRMLKMPLLLLQHCQQKASCPQPKHNTSYKTCKRCLKTSVTLPTFNKRLFLTHGIQTDTHVIRLVAQDTVPTLLTIPKQQPPVVGRPYHSLPLLQYKKSFIQKTNTVIREIFVCK